MSQDGPQMALNSPKLAKDSFKMGQVGHGRRQDAKTLIFLRFFKVFKRLQKVTSHSEPPTARRAGAPGRVGRGLKALPFFVFLRFRGFREVKLRKAGIYTP